MMDTENENVPELKEVENQGNKSALQHNIESKGSNAYYFAHAFKATGPTWDGKIEPRLLSKSESSISIDASNDAIHHTKRGVRSSFDYAKSTISKYGFLDEGSKVRIYIELPGVGENHTDEQVQLEYTDSSFCLRVLNPNSTDDCLSFAKLYGLIDKATVKVKSDRIVITLFKKKKIKFEDDKMENGEDAGATLTEQTFEEWKTIGAHSYPDSDDYTD
jgi:hypothetical protein